jgi:hypothetical protein
VELSRDASTLSLWNLDGDEGISADINWTPPTPAVVAEPWEKETDKDWVDGRFSKMDAGPYLNATIDYEGPKGKVRSYKGTAIKVGTWGEGALVFDRNQLRMATAWTGGYLNHSSRRFGLLNTPTPAGTQMYTTSGLAGWANAKGEFVSTHPATAPLPHEWGKFKGAYLNGPRTILNYTIGETEIFDRPWAVPFAGTTAIYRHIEIVAAKSKLLCLAAETKDPVEIKDFGGTPVALAGPEADTLAVFVLGAGKLAIQDKSRIVVEYPSGDEPQYSLITAWRGPRNRIGDAMKNIPFATAAKVPVRRLILPPRLRWDEPVQTKLVVGEDTGGPFVVDTFTLPYENPWNALFFVTGVDFYADHVTAICTAHGDVWLVGEVKNELRWKRYATGLYQPLGLKVVDGKIIVLERGQLTRLHDLNNNGEADFYECLNNDWHTGGGEHSFDTCLETDPEGNFYFFKTGDDHTPTGGCLIKIAKDGSKSEIFATGFRHPIGLGISPSGLISGADQEGNWMPVTRLDLYKKGGFYGDMRTHHRAEPPKTYDEPLLWLPKEADNSAGGQVWVPKGSWGPLGGQMLHLSYGRCQAFAILPDGEVGDFTNFQAGAVNLGLKFLSGSARARFNSKDGHLYVVGLRGWQTAAQKDGCLQRVRYTGKPMPFPIAFRVLPDGVRLTFEQPIDPKSISDLSKFKVGRCNYHWSSDYGSKNWSVADPKKEGIDKVEVVGAELSPDGKSLSIRFADKRPAMMTKIEYDVRSTDGAKRAGAVYTTIR